MVNIKPPRIGDILIQQGFITPNHVEIALKIQKLKRKFLGEILKELNFISPTELAIALARQSGLQYVNLEEVVPNKDALELITYDEAKWLQVIPLDIEGRVVTVIIDDPYNVKKQIEIKNRLKDYKLQFAISDKEAIERHIEIFYRLYNKPIERELEEEIGRFASGSGDVVRLTNLFIDTAVYLNGSDIHISPLQDMSYFFVRIDGILHQIAVIPVFVHNNVVARIKLLGEMNVAERRIPQDGSFSYETLGMNIDIRVSTLPTPYGEKVVMRLLRKEISKLNLSFLGYLDFQLEELKRAISLPYGMVLVTGPTGSGKSTTLYSMLRSVDYLSRNVVTVEDPIEYKFNFIYQTEVNTSAGYKFSTALKYLMRQDPDVILVGEIRDEETADMCVMASNTGHLLLSTIHANDALTTIYRLLSLTSEKDTALSTLKVISAQRLTRKLCSYCKQEDPERLEFLKKRYPLVWDKIDFEPKVYRGIGCNKCRGTGYIGRTVVSEVLSFDLDLIDAFLRNKPMREIEELLQEKGFWSMEMTGIWKILHGETDYDEIRRTVTG